MNKIIAFKIQREFDRQRLDIVIPALYPDITRSSLKSRDMIICVNEKTVKLSHKLKEGDIIRFELPEPKTIDLIPQDIDFDIVYADDDIAVVNKPRGLTVHPSTGHEDGTLVNGLLYRMDGKLSSIGGKIRPGIVHRLDKDTSGLLVVALNDKAHHKLSDDFKHHKIIKIYHAIVKGELSIEGRIEAPIGRSMRDRKKMAVREDGKKAVTIYKVLKYFNEASYVEVNILTGRTHQIRVHLSHIGHPIIADPIYSRGASKYKIYGMALCAKRLEFEHPITGEAMKFEIELPDGFKRILEML